MRIAILGICCVAFLVSPMHGEDATSISTSKGESMHIGGTITLEQSNTPLKQPNTNKRPVPIRVWAMRLAVHDGNQIIPPTKQEIFSASTEQPKTTAAPDGKYSLSVGPGQYSVFAFADFNENGRWDPKHPEPFGWYAVEASGKFAPIEVINQDLDDIDLVLRAPQPFTRETQRAPGGTLRQIKGYPVLQLSGDAHTRGFAHGKLVAPQIVDFFRFYVLEDKFSSAKKYEDGFAKFLNTHFSYPEPFVTECEAVIEGMRDSGANLYLPELGRDFSLTDLYAINGYIETRAMRSSCTQFAAWGPRTESTDVDGGMITGRNMDGEIDIRKVTVSHFLLFAVDPVEKGQKRFVSMMWPGFVATISGMNEEGFYTMENAGITGPGPVVDRLVPFSWVMRESLAKLGADATPSSLRKLAKPFENSSGGICGPGCITLFATPYTGQDEPAFVLEGDRFGDALRVAEAAAPQIPHALVLSNHHREYGVTDEQPQMNFDKHPSFSSLWRYEAGMHKLEAWHRIDRKIGTSEMQELLQTVAHGTTEYAIITRPNRRQFDVAVASMRAEPWDAPHRKWTTFDFDDVFGE